MKRQNSGVDKSEVERVFKVDVFHVQLRSKGGHVMEVSCTCDYSGKEFVRENGHPLCDSQLRGESLNTVCEHEAAAVVHHYSRFQNQIEYDVEEVR